jgi:hypothetical protein
MLFAKSSPTKVLEFFFLETPTMNRPIKSVQENINLAMEFHPSLPLLSFCKLTQTTHTLSILGIYSKKTKPYTPPPLAARKLKIVLSTSAHDNFHKAFDLDPFI